eukprot:scaffold123484_cov28-Tisochrysis_lutea.AAC.3
MVQSKYTPHLALCYHTEVGRYGLHMVPGPMGHSKRQLATVADKPKVKLPCMLMSSGVLKQMR